MKVVNMGLWSIWLSGFALISVSFYSTERLPPLIDQVTKTSKVNSDGVSEPADPIITIFSAPRPFTGSIGDRQNLALRSWLGLSPQIKLVLFSQHSSVLSFAQSFGSRVLVEPNIDFTFLGTPFFHSMMARSYSVESGISVLAHPEAVLFQDLISTLNYAYKLDRDWLLIASLRSTSRGRHRRREDRKRIQNDEKIIVVQSPCEAEKLMAWNGADLPLHSAVLPPFLYGRGVHDEWFVNEALSSGFRFVFDASLTVSSFIPDGDSEYDNRSWEYSGNSNLGTEYGSLFYRNSNYSDVPRLIKRDGRYIFVDATEKSKDCSSTGRIKVREDLGFRFSLESLLPVVADENKTVVLAVSGYSYKDMLMSWVCRLRRLNVTNFVVSALDEEIYRFSIHQGLPVFDDSLAPKNISFDDCHFGTNCFQRVTKVKSRTVLKILKLGYNVLLSDVDVYWFKNPLPFLSSFGPTVLLAQSDEYNQTGPINIPRRLNSGFYFARSDSNTIAAIEKIVRHAESSVMSEQPSFYDTLCGENGSKRVGNDKCLEPETNLTVHFLNRNLFPNGAYRELWQSKNVKKSCEKIGCFVLHNNWINGRQKKLERQVSSGLWEYDTTSRMCLQSRHFYYY